MSSAEGIGYVAFSRPINSKSTQIGAGSGMCCGLRPLIFIWINLGATALCVANCHCTGAEFLYPGAKSKTIHG
jgi:hypothetical protein